MVEYIRSDLEAILFHIKIAEAHAAGRSLYGPDPDGAGPLLPGLIPTYNLSWGLRTVDGSYNNLLPGREYWGAANQPFKAHVDPVYVAADGSHDFDGAGPAPALSGQLTYAPSADPGSRVFDSSLRTISNLIVDQTLDNPAAIIESMRRDGIQGDLLPIALRVKAAYEPLQPLFEAVDDKSDAYAEAKAAAAVNPTQANRDAAAAALAALTLAEKSLSDARKLDPAGDQPSFDALLASLGIELSGANVVLPAIATDEGLSAPFNSWFTLFGQFFDHGLDLINKGGSGTVFIPLKTDDPLYDPGPDGIAGNGDDPRTNFMVLTRATTAPGADGQFGTADDVMPLNTTTSFVDQNQTYSSHPSHQVFLREYAMVNGRPEATGMLIEGKGRPLDNVPAGGMANWGELKEYTRAFLGIELTDQDVGQVPLLRTDPYGNFIPNPVTGFPQVILGIGSDGIPNTADDIVASGTPANPINLATVSVTVGTTTYTGAVRTTSAFLADIAHNAVPKGLADGDITIGLTNPGNGSTVYDNELLDRHFIAGDGRVNENVGLTAVHHIFHAEHNRMVDHTKEVVLADAAAMLAAGAAELEAVAFLNEWLAVDVTTVPTSATGLVWDGERLFQAAKFGTEMQYQHLVFEEFARKVQPSIDAFIVPDGYDAEINPSIMAEFAHVVYRFGHSMLTETIDKFDESFTPNHISLIEGFLNPVAFDANGMLTDGVAAGDIVRGMTRQVGNQIDEFVTTALRNNLLGLPLDLATINLARGRDTGVPTLNEARREFFEVTNGNPALKPYESWTDFAANLKNEASIINFVAAYGTHAVITGETTTEGKRAAALAIITGADQIVTPDDPATAVNEERKILAPDDAVDFLNATGAWKPDGTGPNDDTRGGLEKVDLWIGGLAERTMPFGGMLGSTFNFVFEVQMESLQNGDRFYYLQRNTGQHLFEQLEANSLASMIMAHTDAKHLPHDVFSTPGFILEVDPTKQFNDLDGDGDLEQEDPEGPLLTSRLVVRNDPSTPTVDTNFLQYKGDEHVVLGGTEADDKLIGGIGDDTLYGDGGDDRLEGNFGNDELRGGDGDDIMTDMGGDDTFKGGKGNDAIQGGSGIDLILAGDGNDFAVLGTDADGQIFGGLGNDFLLSAPAALPAFGNEGDDWIEDGGNAAVFGDNLDDGFARDAIRGNDVMVGVGGGFDEFVGEGGDDIMVGSLGSAKHAGMSGFDWVTYKNHTAGIDASFLDGFVFDEAPIDPADIGLQRFESVEGLSGTRFNDRLTGSDFTAADRVPGGPDHAFLGSFLDAQGIGLIDGLQALVGNGVDFFSAGDIILGGAGSDEIVGGGGDDIIDGDKWLNVRISIRANNDGTGPEIENGSANSLTDLSARIFSGQINPGQLVIVREILTADGADDFDMAIFSGNLAEYDIEGRTTSANGLELTKASDTNGDGTITISHARGTQLDGTDRVGNMEALRFADRTLVISGVNPSAPVLDLNASGAVTTTINYRDEFTTKAFNNSNGTTLWNTSWVENGDNNVAATGQIQTDGTADPGNNILRFIGGTTAAFDGASITRAVDLSAVSAATFSFNYGYIGVDQGETLTVEFAPDGIAFTTIGTISGGSMTIGGVTTTTPLAGGTTQLDANSGAGTPRLFTTTVAGGANAAVRLTTSALNAAGEIFRVDNVDFTASTSVQAPGSDGTGFISTYTENGTPVAIALGSAILDDDESIVLSAQVRMTNAEAFDVLEIAGTLPVGITGAVDTSVPGEITVNLQGSASEAAYQTAIEAVRFSNTSDNPSTTPRNIWVTVENRDGPSQPAIATVNILAVNDAPVAVADTIITNIAAGGAIVIPEWALLANDIDADSDVLDVTAVSAAAGVTGLLLNAGSVTLSDNTTPGGSFVYTASDGAATSNATVTLTGQGTDAGTGTVQVADNFNGVNTATRSAADNSTGTVPWTTSWTETDDDANIRTGQIQIDGGGNAGTNQLRFLNGDGASITRAVNLSGATTATLTLNFDKNGIDVGESVQVQFAADGATFVTLNTITNTGNNGGAAGTLSLALTGALGANSAIRFVGSAISAVGENIRIDNVAIAYALAPASVSGTVTGTSAGEILVGNDVGTVLNALGGNDRIFAGGGNDTVDAGAGDDLIGHNVVTGGRDFIDGGANATAAGDRVIIEGDDSAENYVVYARANVPTALAGGLNANTEIVITRGGIVIAELDNVEEITVNTRGGDDTVEAVGDFRPTSLNFNTITVTGGPNDTIDSSRLTSAHRLVLDTSGSAIAVQTTLADVEFADLFAGLRPFDSLGAGHFVAGGLHGNSTFGRGQGFDFSSIDFEYAATLLEPGLRMGAADYLIG